MSETVKNSEKTRCRIISVLSGFRALLSSIARFQTKTDDKQTEPWDKYR